MSAARSILAFVLFALVLSACAAPAARPPAPDSERTYRGLTLDEWIAVPWQARGKVDDGEAEFTIQRDVAKTLYPLRAFAAESPRALARLARLAADLDEDVREEAVEYLVEIALSSEPNQAQAMDAAMALVGSPDDGVASTLMLAIAHELEDEPAVLERLGPARTETIVSRLEPLLFGTSSEPLSQGLDVVDVFASRSAELDRRFLAWLSAPSAQFRASDAADELDDFAWDCVQPKVQPRHPALALAAARTAAALAPAEPAYQTTIALALWRHGKREEALAASRRAVEANADLESEYTNRILDCDHYLSLDSTWAPR